MSFRICPYLSNVYGRVYDVYLNSVHDSGTDSGCCLMFQHVNPQLLGRCPKKSTSFQRFDPFSSSVSIFSPPKTEPGPGRQAKAAAAFDCLWSFWKLDSTRPHQRARFFADGGFLKQGYPPLPSSHPFQDGILKQIIQLLGYPHLWKAPYVSIYLSIYRSIYLSIFPSIYCFNIFYL